MKKWWNRLGVRLFVIVLLSSSLPVAVLGLAAVRSSEHALEEVIERANKEVVNRSMQLAENRIGDIAGRVRLAVETLALPQLPPKEQEWELWYLIKAVPEIETAAVADAAGKEQVKVARDRYFSAQELTDLSGSAVFEKAKGTGVYFGDVRTEKDGTRVMPIGFDLSDAESGRRFGVLVAEIDLRALLPKIVSRPVGKTGIVYIADSNGRLIAHPDFSRVLAGETVADKPLARKMVAATGYQVVSSRYVNPAGKRVLGLGRASKMLGWLFVVEQEASEALAVPRSLLRNLSAVLAAVLFISAAIGFYIVRGIARPMERLAAGAQRVKQGQLDERVPVTSRDEIGRVTRAFNQMVESLARAEAERSRTEWLRDREAELEEAMRGHRDLNELHHHILTALCHATGARVGVLFIQVDTDGGYRRSAGFALTETDSLISRFEKGEGLIGQAAEDGKPKLLSDLPEEYAMISCGLGEGTPRHVLVYPFVFGESVVAVAEIGKWQIFSDLERSYLETVAERVAVVLQSAQLRPPAFGRFQGKTDARSYASNRRV